MEARTRYTARTEGVVVQEMGDELLIYDERTDVAHCLSAVAAAVWRQCRTEASFEELVDAVGTSGGADAETVVLTALQELSAKELMAAGTPKNLVSRREVLGRMAKMSAVAVVAAPLIVSARVPDAEAAGSPNSCRAIGQTCTPANSANAANNCCGTAYCSAASTCTACVASGGAEPTVCTGSQGNNVANFRCCSGSCGNGSNMNKCA